MPSKFDPKDGSIPRILRQRIEGWRADPPSSQFQQYGPINRYLNLKFNHDNHMVKPQALFRDPVPGPEADLVAHHGADIDDPLPEDEIDADAVQDLRVGIHEGDVSIDSTLNGLVDKRVKAGSKVYPDFVVCTFVGNPREFGAEARKDRVLVVMEIASLPRKKDRSNLSDEDLEGKREAVLKQLENYMDRLGEKGDRWDDDVVGIALFGTEVSFLLPHDGSGGNFKRWKNYKSGTKEWFSLYGKEFLKFVNAARDQ